MMAASVGLRRARAVGPDARDDGLPRSVRADVLGAGVMLDPEIDAAAVMYGDLDRAGLDLRRHRGGAPVADCAAGKLSYCQSIGRVEKAYAEGGFGDFYR